jgi:hypothetical protein
MQPWRSLAAWARFWCGLAKAAFAYTRPGSLGAQGQIIFCTKPNWPWMMTYA